MLSLRQLFHNLPAHTNAAARHLRQCAAPGVRLLASLVLAAAVVACAAPAPEPGKGDAADVVAQPAPAGSAPVTDAPEVSTQPSVPRPPSNTEIRQDREIVQAETPKSPAASSQPVTIDTSCKSDKDCTVKNVGNCCGEYPACVNVNSPTDPAGVQAQCAKQGMASICGFPVISGCSCKAGKCESSGGGEIAQ